MGLFLLVCLGLSCAKAIRQGLSKEWQTGSSLRARGQLQSIPATLHQEAAAAGMEMKKMQDNMEQLQDALNRNDAVQSLAAQLAQEATSTSMLLDQLLKGLQQLDASLEEVRQEDESLAYQPTLFELKSTALPGMRSSFTFYQMGLRQMQFLFEQLEEGAAEETIKRAKDTLRYEVDNIRQIRSELLQKMQKLLAGLQQLHKELSDHLGHAEPEGSSLAAAWAAVEGRELDEAMALVHKQHPGDAVGAEMMQLLEFLRDQNFNQASHEAEWKSRRPLHLAAAKGMPKEAELLLEVKADVDAQVPATGDTPLLYAAVQLARHKADAEGKDFQSVVDILLRHGADKAKANRKHKAPQDYLS